MRIVGPPARRGLRGGDLGTVLLAAWTAVAFALGAASGATGFYDRTVRPLVARGPEAISRWLAARAALPERLELAVLPQELARLAREPGWSEYEAGAEGTLAAGGVKVRVQVHAPKAEASNPAAAHGPLRVNVVGEVSLLGMRRFSLRPLPAGGDAAAWLFHRALRREDVIALRYELVELALNGEPLGLRALQEGFEQPVLEHARRPDGPILRFDDAASRREADRMRAFPGAAPGGAGSFEASAIQGVGSRGALDDPAAGELYAQAAAELEAFRRGERTVGEVFDAPRLARWFALSDLLGAERGMGWQTLRFYWNPMTARLEPIGAAGKCSPTVALSSMRRGERDARGHPLREARPFHERVFADPAFHALYLAELERVSAPAYVDALLAELGPELRRTTAILDRELPHLAPPEALLRRNQAYLRTVLEPADGLRASLAAAEGSALRIQVANLQALPLEVLALEVPGRGGAPGAAVPLVAPYQLAGRREGEAVAYETLRFEVPRPSQPAQLAEAHVRYRVLGTRAERSVALAPEPPDRALPPGATRLPASPARFAFLAPSGAGGAFEVRPGRWTLDTDLVVPAGARLRVGPGTTLDLVRGAKILSRSPVELRGRADAPVAIVSSDRSGQGLAVLQAGSPSRIEHARFEGLRGARELGGRLGAAVTFYESPVEISSSTFASNAAARALLAVRSRLTLDGSTLRNGPGDALGCDFCEIEVIRSHILDFQGDAIVVSGGTGRLDDVEVEGAGGAGVRARAASELVAARLRVAHAGFGVVAEDRSKLRVEDLHVRECTWASAALQGKSEPGPAELRVSKLNGETTELRHLVQAGNVAVLDGEPLAASPERTLREALHGQPRAVAAKR